MFRRTALLVAGLVIILGGDAPGAPLDPRDFESLGQLSGPVWSISFDGVLTFGDGQQVQGVNAGGRLVFTFDSIDNFWLGWQPNAIGNVTFLSKSHFNISGINLSGLDWKLEMYEPFGSEEGVLMDHPYPVGYAPGATQGGQGAAGGAGGESILGWQGNSGLDGGGGGTALDSPQPGAGELPLFPRGARMGMGAGAIELGALGAVRILGNISADGGDGGYAGQNIYSATWGGGGGGGGGLLIHGDTVVVEGQVSARGGKGGDSFTSFFGTGGGGGGGEVAILAGRGGIDVIGGIDVRGGDGGQWGGSPTVWSGSPGEDGRIFLQSSSYIRISGQVLGNLNVAIVPEPHAGLLLLLGVPAALAFRGRARASA